MLRNYLLLSWRVLWRRRFYALISLFGISFTLVVLMVATALLDHIFAPMAPEVRQDRTLAIYRARFVGPHAVWGSAPGFRLLDRYARRLPGVERLGLVSTPVSVVSYVGGARIESTLRRTDAEYFRILDFAFLEGGPIADHDVSNGAMVAVINEATRDRFFGGAPAAGKIIEADGQRFRVIGVVRNVPASRMLCAGDLFVPLTTAKTDAYKEEVLGDFYGLLLARSAADFPAIKAELRARVAAVEMPDPEVEQFFAPAETHVEAVAWQQFGGGREESGSAARLWGALLVASLSFMLLPIVNLVNLNVSRIMERASEIGVRKAFGASSLSLVGQFVVENLVLSAIGGLVGLACSAVVLRAITAAGLIPYADLQINVRVFLYGLGLTLVFGLLSGAYPAWRMSRLHPVDALRGRGGTR
jgi:putative ABC transport system permease protein